MNNGTSNIISSLTPNYFPVNSPYVQGGQTTGFQFDYQNEAAVVTNSKVRDISADKISAGTVLVGINIGSSGSGYVLIDGSAQQIIINDGTNNRVLIGYGTF